MSWPVVKLSDVCEHEILRVRTLPVEVEEINYIDIGSVQGKRVSQYKRLRRSEAPGRAQQIVQEGDVILSTVRPNLNTLAMITNYKEDCPLVASTGFCVLRAKSVVLPRFLYGWLQNPDVVRELSALAEAKASYPSVTDGEIFSLSLPLPSLPEQYDIVEELEWKLARLEKIEGNFRAMAETAAQASRSVLTGTFRSLDAPIVKLGDVCDCLDALRIPITKCDRKPGNVPYYGATGIQDYVAGHLFNEPLVLLGEDGAKWGAGERSAFLVEGKSWVNNHVHVLRPTDSLLTSFLIAYLNAIDLTKWVSGVTVPKLTQSRMKQIPLPLPSLPEQHQIVEELEWKLSRLEKVERLAREGLTVCEQARWAVLAEAFRQADGTALRQGCNAAGQAEQPAT